MSIKIENVSYSYFPKDKNLKYALDNISFEINDGEFLAIVGKTGSGKSTLIQMLNALLVPQKGFINIDNKYIVSSDKKIRTKNYFELKKKVGLVFQFPEYQLFEETILKDVKFGPKNFGLTEEEAEKVSKKTLDDLGLNESYYEKSPFEISGGERRSVAIAGVLASNPDILVFDEPTAGLDHKRKEEVTKLMKKLHEESKTIIVVTHDMDLVLNFADRVCVLNDSKLVKISTPLELFNDENVTKYNLEIPMFFKLKNALAKIDFKYDLSKINDVDSFVKFMKEKHHE